MAIYGVQAKHYSTLLEALIGQKEDQIRLLESEVEELEAVLEGLMEEHNGEI